MSQHTSQTSGPYTVVPLGGHKGIPRVDGHAPLPRWVAFIQPMSLTCLGVFGRLTYHMATETIITRQHLEELNDHWHEMEQLDLVRLQGTTIELRYFPDLDNPQHVAAVKAEKAAR